MKAKIKGCAKGYAKGCAKGGKGCAKEYVKECAKLYWKNINHGNTLAVIKPLLC
jgi:hypothetical protein